MVLSHWLSFFIFRWGWEYLLFPGEEVLSEFVSVSCNIKYIKANEIQPIVLSWYSFWNHHYFYETKFVNS